MKRGLKLPTGSVCLTFRGTSLPAGVDRRDNRDDSRHNGAVGRPIVAQLRSGYRCLPHFLPSQIATDGGGVIVLRCPVGALGASAPASARQEPAELERPAAEELTKFGGQWPVGIIRRRRAHPGRPRGLRTR
jgi:hypothetical protein